MGAGGITYDSYYTLAGLNIALGSGHDTLRIASTSSSTTRVNGGVFGSDTFNVQATTGALYLTGAALGNNVFNLGSTAPSSGGSVKNIAGPVFITGGTSVLRLITLAADGSNTINVDDSGDSANNSGDMTSSAVTGLGMGSGVTFVSVNAVNVTLGPGNISFDAQGANSRTVITVSAGTGTNNAVLSFSAGFYGDLTLVNFATATLNVVGNFSGQFYDAAAVTAVTMAGSLTSNGLLEVGSIGTMTVGGNLAGMVVASGLLGNLTVSGSTSGAIIAGEVNLITMPAASLSFSGVIASQGDVGVIQRDSSGNAVTNGYQRLDPVRRH